MIQLLSRIISFFSLTAAVLAPVAASAFPTSTYAETSVLSTGRWVKVGVTTTGMYLLTTAELRSLGFSDPSRVAVYGYGGGRINDYLSLSTFVDDLPRVASAVTSRGVVFFANGPETWRLTPGRVHENKWMEHVINPYTETTYYFLTETDTPTVVEKDGVAGTAGASEVATTFVERLWHERDIVTIKETGHNLYGEDFKMNSSQSFTFDLTDRVEDTKVWMAVRFMAECPNETSTVRYTANGVALPSDSYDNIRPSLGTYVYGDTCLSRKQFDLTGTRLSLGISHSASGTIRKANLDRIDINYTRRLALPSAGTLYFSTTASCNSLDGVGAGQGLHVWDVTDPLHVTEMNLSVDGGKASWMSEYSGRRTYIAWREDASMRAPSRVGNVPNQDIHSMETPDMVIVTISSLLSQAERIANLHRNHADSLKVLVVAAENVYNEFSSGVADPGAIRRMLKMFHDRGSANPGGSTLQYCMLIGRPIFDHRRKTSSLAGVTVETMPVWQTDVSTNDNSSYSSDDPLAMLADGSGNNQATAELDISIGRLPVSSVAEANVYISKLDEYMNNPSAGDWLSRMLLIADDQDSGIHMKQSETVADGVMSTDADKMMFDKLYIDAYPKINGTVPEARSAMFRKLDDGALWVQYIGHASHNSWSHEKLLVSTDVDKMYLKRLPVIFAATCDFGRWDSNETCGAEAMLLTEGGGTIAICTATRPVYIPQNGNLSRNIGATLMRRGPGGRMLTVGEVIRYAKNYKYVNANGRPSSDTNRLRYVLFGDPALPMAIPSNNIVVETINGVNVESEAADDEEPATVKARQRAVITGRVTTPSGEVMDDFDGSLKISLFDAEYSTTSSGRGDDSNPGEQVTFQQQGNLLYNGVGKIEGGRFSVTVNMPTDVKQNYRNATLNAIATSTDGRRASGLNRNFYVYGYDEEAQPDTIAPVVESIYLNHSTFKNGDTVNDSPMLIATVSDDTGINLSTAGIGHQMSVRLDGNKSFTDVSGFFTAAEDGSPSGTIAYPLEGISDGAHSLTLTVWDISNNPTMATVDFFVDSTLQPKLFDVYTDTNPASEEARFYVSHNRPDASLTVTIEVFNLNGQPQWSSTVTGRSDMFTTSPVVWDLTDMTGRRVPRGIYLYRASLSADGGETSTSASRRLAVTAR